MASYDEETRQLAASLSGNTVIESSKLANTMTDLATRLAEVIVTEAMKMAQRQICGTESFPENSNTAAATEMRQWVRELREYGIMDQRERDDYLSRITDYETHHVPELDAVG